MIVVNFFHWESASARGFNGDIGHKTKTELDANLRLFYDEARIKNTAEIFECFRVLFLNNPPYQKGIHIATDPAFQQSNQMLDAKHKDIKKHGEQNVKHKPAIELEDLQRRKESAVISPTTPQGLLYKVWFHFTLYFCRRGRDEQRNFTKSSFLFLQDENSKWYATMAHDEARKARLGGKGDTATN